MHDQTLQLCCVLFINIANVFVCTSDRPVPMPCHVTVFVNIPSMRMHFGQIDHWGTRSFCGDDLRRVRYADRPGSLLECVTFSFIVRLRNVPLCSESMRSKSCTTWYSSS